MLVKENAWIPFHVVACSSEEYGTQVDLIASQKIPSARSWESSRTGSFPVEIVLRFHYRAEVSHVLIATKVGKNIPEIEFFIGDGLSGSFLDAEYRLAGKTEFIYNKLEQLPLQGIGNYLKIKILSAPKKNADNPFSQVSIATLKIWGRYTNYLAKIKNNEAPIIDQQSTIDQLLINQGIPIDLLAWSDADNRQFEYAAVDDRTRETLIDMSRIKDQALKQQDFEALKALAEDISNVYRIGQEILSIQREINMTIAKEDFSRAITLKNRLRQLETKRDSYDAMYETRRYEDMVRMERPGTADYLKALNKMNEEADLEARQRELKNQQKKIEVQDIVEEQKKDVPVVQIVQPQQEEKKREGIEIDGVDKTAWWDKVQGEDMRLKQSKKKKKQEKEEAIEDKEENPFNFNEGDVDLEMYLKPLLSGVGENVPSIPAEVLRRLHQLGYLTVFGVKLWSAIHSENWRHREAAAQAVLNFIEMPLPQKYMNGKSKRLFGACCQLAKIACEDKVLQIYYLGLKILTTALSPPVCGTDVSPQMINKVLNEFVPILIDKISEFNFRAKDISLHTLLAIYKHPAAQIGDLVANTLKICILDPNYYSLFVPPDKQPARVMMTRLEIMLFIVQDRGYDERQWNWHDVFAHLCVPCLFHSSNEVRTTAMQLIVALYQIVGEEVRNFVLEIDNMKPSILETLLEKMDQVSGEAMKNQKIREAKQGNLQVIKEDEKGEDQQNLQQNLSQIPQNKSLVKDNSQKMLKNQVNPEEEQKQQNVVKQILFTVDAVLNVTSLKYPCGLIVSSNPPGCLYSGMQMDNTAQLITNINMESPQSYPHFENSTLEFFNIRASSTIIVDIRSITNIGKSNQEIKEIGWSIFPVYQEDGAMNSGSFQIPIFKPPVSAYIVQMMSNEPNPWEYLTKLMSEKKYSIAYLGDSSMIVTIQPFALRSKFDVYKTESLQFTYLPQDKVKKIQWTADSEKKAFKGKKIKDLVGKQDPKEYLAQTRKIILDQYKIFEPQ